MREEIRPPRLEFPIVKPSKRSSRIFDSSTEPVDLVVLCCVFVGCVLILRATRESLTPYRRDPCQLKIQTKILSKSSRCEAKNNSTGTQYAAHPSKFQCPATNSLENDGPRETMVKKIWGGDYTHKKLIRLLNLKIATIVANLVLLETTTMIRGIIIILILLVFN